MLDAAMQRTYSAAPETFFTGGGNQSFGNFESWEDDDRPTVETAFQHSINLAFVRIMRDVVNYYTAANGVRVKRLLGNPDDPQREVYLKRFIEADSRRFLYRFYKDYQGLNGDRSDGDMAERTQPLAKAGDSLPVDPSEGAPRPFYTFLVPLLPNMDLSEKELWELYLTYSPERMNLADRGYVAGLHPLELWLVRVSAEHPGASWKRDHRSQRPGAPGGLSLAVQRQHPQAGHPHPDPARAGRVRAGSMRAGRRSAIRSRIWCRRSAPRSAPPATGRTRSPS